MIIESIKLENFKSHANTEISFNKGISIILGENGAGKSSIFEAISYALFKKFDGNKKDLVRKNDDSTINKKMNVTLNFAHDSNHYILKRGSNNNKAVAQLDLIKDNKKIILAKSDSEVTKTLKEILNIDPDSFLNAVYIRQGEITDLIDKTASERKQFISHLLNLDSLETAWDEMKDIVDEYKDKKNINEGKLEYYDGHVSEKETIESNLEEKNKCIGKYQQKINELMDTIKEIEENKNKLEHDKQLHESLKTNLQSQTALVGRIEKNRTQLENELENITNAEKESVILEKKIRPLDKLKELVDLKNKIDSLRKEIKQDNDKIDEIGKYKKQQENNLKDYQSYVDTEQSIKKIKEEQDTLNKEKEQLLTQTTLINADKEQKSNLLKEIRDSVSKANNIFGSEFSNPQEIRSAIRSKEEDIKEESEKYKEIIKKCEDGNTIIESKIKDIQKSKAELDQTEGICPICQSPISDEKHKELNDHYTASIVELGITKRDNTIEIVKNEREVKLLEECQEKIDSINIDKLSEKNSEFQQLVVKLRNSKEVEDKYDAVNNKLNELNSTIEEKDILMQLSKEGYILYNSASDYLNKAMDIEKIIESRELKIQEENNLKDKIREIQSTVRISDDINREIKYLENEANKYHQLQGQIKDKDNKVKQIEEIQKDLIESKNEVANIERLIAELSFDKEKYDKTNGEYTSSTEKLQSYNIELAKVQTEKESQENRIKELTKTIRELDDIKADQENIKNYIKILEQIRDLYHKDGVQRTIRTLVGPEIEEKTSEIFNEFDFRDYAGISLDDDYELNVIRGKELIPVSMVSGGEEVVISLALRLGIAQVITQDKTELLILDEPTIHLDSERRTDLIEIIRDINVVPQMLVVTHDDEMLNLQANHIHIKKENGVSTCQQFTE